MLKSFALSAILVLSSSGVLAVPENCCILAKSFYSESAISTPCASIDSIYGTQSWKCDKGSITYNGNDLVAQVGEDQVALHVDPDPHSSAQHFTVVMKCTGKTSGKQQVSNPLFCPTLSSKLMVGLGPIFDEPCAGDIKVSSITPLENFTCDVPQAMVY